MTIQAGASGTAAVTRTVTDADLFSGGPGPDVATDLDPGDGDTE